MASRDVYLIAFSNLPFNCLWQDLKDLIRSVTQSVIHVEVYASVSGQTKGTGHALVVGLAAARKVEAELNGRRWQGRTIQTVLKYDYQNQNPTSYQTFSATNLDGVSQSSLPSTVSGAYQSSPYYQSSGQALPGQNSLSSIGGHTYHQQVLKSASGASSGVQNPGTQAPLIVDGTANSKPRIQ